MVDRVLVKKVEEKAVSEGGIILPDSAQEKDLVYGIVIDTGLKKEGYPKCTDDDYNIKIGDKVAFVKYAAANITDGIDNYLIMRYDDILAVIK